MIVANKLAHARYVLINRLATPLASFLLLMIIAKQSDVLLGEYAVAMAFYFVMQMLPLLGLTTYVMREVARAPEQAGRYFTSIGFLSVIGCILVDLLLYTSLGFLDYSQNIREGLQILALVIIPGILVFIAELIFMSLHRARIVGILALGENLVRILASLGVLVLDGGLAELMWVFLCTRLAALAAYLMTMSRQGILRGWEWPNLELLHNTLRVLPAFLVGTLLLAFSGRLDFFVLSVAQAVEAIGYYAIGYRVFDISIVILSGLIMAIFPQVARQFVGASLQYRVSLKIILQGFSVALAIFSLICILFAEYYVLLLFPNQYPAPVDVTRLFMIVLLVAGMDHLSSSLLHASDMQLQDARALALGSTCYAGLLLWLVPEMGLIGAVIARAITAMVQLGVRLRALQAKLGCLVTWADCIRLCLFLGLLIIVAAATLNAGFLVKSLLILPGLLLLLPLAAISLGLFRPLRVLRFYWPKEKDLEDAGRPRSLFGNLVADSRRLQRMRRQERVFRRGGENQHRGALAVILFRLASSLQQSGYSLAARVLTIMCAILTGVAIDPRSAIGPGLVIVNPGRIRLAANAGSNLTLKESFQIVSTNDNAPEFGHGVELGSGSGDQLA